MERRLGAEVTALETLIARHGLPAKANTLIKVRKPLAGIAALVDFWWQRVERDLEERVLDASWTHGVDEWLLPMMDLREKLSRTRCPGQKAKLTLALQGHPLKAGQIAIDRVLCGADFKHDFSHPTWLADKSI